MFLTNFIGMTLDIMGVFQIAADFWICIVFNFKLSVRELDCSMYEWTRWKYYESPAWIVRWLETSEVTLLSDSRWFPLRRVCTNRTIWLLCNWHEWSDKGSFQLKMISVTQYGGEYLTAFSTPWSMVVKVFLNWIEIQWIRQIQGIW